MQPIKSNF